MIFQKTYMMFLEAIFINDFQEGENLVKHKSQLIFLFVLLSASQLGKLDILRQYTCVVGPR